MLNKLTNELLWKDRFLLTFEKDLHELYATPAFMEIVHSIIDNSPSPESENALSIIKENVKSIFYHERLNTQYDALRRIVSHVKEQGCSAASAHISIFMAMWIYDLTGIPTSPATASSEQNDWDVRKTWPADYRCNDGHYVRSKNEVLIDNWLYQHDICHAYEKAIFSETGDRFFSDFYIPSIDLYIEVWGLTDEMYLAKASRKRQIYTDLGYELLEISGDDVMDLDDFLTRNILTRKHKTRKK